MNGICNYSNAMMEPRLSKIVISMSDTSGDLLYTITGQKPVKTRAKKSIAAFKRVKGEIVGSKVTLRGKMMMNFVRYFVDIVLLREKNFLGFDWRKSVSRNSFCCGFTDITIFPEIDYDKVTQASGFNVVFVFESKSKDDTLKLLKHMNFPIKLDT